jgi:hypothetical protein
MRCLGSISFERRTKSDREAQGESIRLDPKLYPAAGAAQEDRLIDDPFCEILEPLLGSLTGKIHTEEVWRLIGKEDKGRRTQDDLNRRGAVMKRLGWRLKQLRANGERGCFYVKGTAEQQRTMVTREQLHGPSPM